VEDQLDRRGRELLRRMCQDHFNMRAANETRLRAVLDTEAVTHGTVEAGDAISRATGQQVAKRQVEALAARASFDVEECYATRTTVKEEAGDDDVLVISADGKGIVMRPDALRPATAKAAAVQPTSWHVVCPRERSGTVSASLRSEPSTS
jgi:hypothetical protein